MELTIAIGCALAFSFTNGFHDTANAIATLVATRTARPLQAIVLASVFNVLGALIVGTAVADTVGGIVDTSSGHPVATIGAGALAAAAWNVVTWWQGLPSSSGHALVGGLVGAAVADSGTGTVDWGGFDGATPHGVVGILVALAISVPAGTLLAAVLRRAAARALQRARRSVDRPIRAGQWVMSAGLAFSHGANDAQKAMGVIAALLVADGRHTTLTVPLWAKAASAVVLTIGTMTGGWRIVRTIGRRIIHLTPLDALVSQTASTGVILGASAVGAPVSTTHVVASSVIGIGAGRRRWRHLHWSVVRSMAFAWVTTLPGSALLGAGTFVAWRAVG